MYRIGTIGVSRTGQQAQFWSTIDPRTDPEGYAKQFGIPIQNIQNANFIETAQLANNAKFVTNVAEAAPGSSPGSGGGLQVVVQQGGTQNNQITYLKPGPWAPATAPTN